VNYGLPDLAGHTVSTVDVDALERQLRTAIMDFEPRLLRETIRVSLLADERDMSHNALTFTIEAMLWAQPIPLRLFFRTAIDLEVGKVEIADWKEGGKG
jgi:type VI secretion system protein ImpF